MAYENEFVAGCHDAAYDYEGGWVSLGLSLEGMKRHLTIMGGYSDEYIKGYCNKLERLGYEFAK